MRKCRANVLHLFTGPIVRIGDAIIKKAVWEYLSDLRNEPATLGLDLDGVITEAPEFFSAWTHSWPGKVVVITYRRDRAKAIADLDERKIRYDKVVLVDRFEAKAEVIAEYSVTMYVDDQPEMLKHVPAGVQVMLFRNEGNYDFEDRRWMFSSETGKQVC